MLVGDLGRLGENSSDRLTLESINSHVAVLDWGQPEVILQRCHEIGFLGSRAPHAGDPAVPPVSGQTRKIFVFDLAQSADAPALCEAIRQLLDSQQVKTFSLGVPPSPGGGNASEPPFPGTAVRSSDLPVSGTPGHRTSEAFSPTSAVDSAADAAESSPNDSQTPAQPKSGPLDLDDLMDQLDQLDP